MKIAIATNNNQLDSPVGTVFGRSDWFCLYDNETKLSEFIANPARHQTDKAGADAVESLIKMGASMVVAGRFGSKVVELFRANNVQMIIPESEMTIKEILNQIK